MVYLTILMQLKFCKVGEKVLAGLVTPPLIPPQGENQRLVPVGAFIPPLRGDKAFRGRFFVNAPGTGAQIPLLGGVRGGFRSMVLV
jgi:hypothetical protein